MTSSKEQRLKWREANKEEYNAKQRELMAARRASNSEHMNRLAREWRAANLEKARAIGRAAYAKRREELKRGLPVDVARVVATVPNSVFALGRSYTDQVSGSVTPAGAVTPDQGAGAQRREGDAVHLLTDSEFKATTWRAPWAPGYALSGSGNT